MTAPEGNPKNPIRNPRAQCPGAGSEFCGARRYNDCVKDLETQGIGTTTPGVTYGKATGTLIIGERLGDLKSLFYGTDIIGQCFVPQAECPWAQQAIQQENNGNNS